MVRHGHVYSVRSATLEESWTGVWTSRNEDGYGRMTVQPLD